MHLHWFLADIELLFVLHVKVQLLGRQCCKQNHWNVWPSKQTSKMWVVFLGDGSTFQSKGKCGPLKILVIEELLVFFLCVFQSRGRYV